MSPVLAFIGSLGTQELVLILVLVLLLFGARKLPEMMKSMGEGVREFRKSSREIMREFEDEASKPASTRTIPPPAASKSGSDGNGKPEKPSTTEEKAGATASSDESQED